MKGWAIASLPMATFFGCAVAEPTPAPTLIPPSYWFLEASDCQAIGEQAKILSEERGVSITRLYRLREMIRTGNLRECSGSADWSDGDSTDITIWVEIINEEPFWGYKAE